MGFLDHSTNNIIIDAVLTDRGRELLAANDGSFTVARYAFADDEVDYTIIKKFGRTIGKEKIEKNTPVFEAQTVASLALRYPIVSYSDPNLIALPTLELDTTLATVEQNKPLRVILKQEIDSDKVTDRQRLLLQESTGSRYTQLQDSSGVVKTTVKVTGNSTGISKTFEVSVKYTT